MSSPCLLADFVSNGFAILHSVDDKITTFPTRTVAEYVLKKRSAFFYMRGSCRVGNALFYRNYNKHS